MSHLASHNPCRARGDHDVDDRDVTPSSRQVQRSGAQATGSCSSGAWGEQTLTLTLMIWDATCQVAVGGGDARARADTAVGGGKEKFERGRTHTTRIPMRVQGFGKCYAHILRAQTQPERAQITFFYSSRPHTHPTRQMS
eukprot:2272733-Prymnesium_polylepis.1